MNAAAWTDAFTNILHAASNLKKTIHATFDHNFGQCRPITKYFSLTDS